MTGEQGKNEELFGSPLHQKETLMSDEIKTKTSFGTATINHFSPDDRENWPNTINIILTFEEAMRLHLGLGQALGKLNSYNRQTIAGRNTGINLAVFPTKERITIREARIKDKE